MFAVLKINRVFLIALGLILVPSFVLLTARGLSTAGNEQDPGAVKVIIMMYHEVKPQSTGKLSITPSEFESDLKSIRQNGYTTITMTDLIDYVEGIGKLPEKPIILTFDDGYQNNYLYAYPLLKEYNMKAVISVIASDTDECTKDKEQNIEVSQITWDEINEMMSSSCVEFQNHTYDMHKITSKRVGCKRAKGESLSHYDEVLSSDLMRCQQDFEVNTGFVPNTFTYPFGEVSKESVPILISLGFRATLSCDEGANYITRDPGVLFGLKRIPRFHSISLQRSIEQWDR